MPAYHWGVLNQLSAALPEIGGTIERGAAAFAVTLLLGFVFPTLQNLWVMPLAVLASSTFPVWWPSMRTWAVAWDPSRDMITVLACS